MLAVQADEDEVVTFCAGAVFIIVRRSVAVTTHPDCFGMVREVDCHAVVEDAQAALPKSVVAICFTVFYDAAVDLIDFLEPAAFHEAR